METNIALKEWAAVVQALEQGAQLLLLRKGGIEDSQGVFELKHREFLLYPTWEHQRPESIRAQRHAPGHLPAPGLILAPEKSEDSLSEVEFRIYAGAAYTRPLQSETPLEGLEKYHIWTPEFIRQRMAYRPREPMLAVVLRAYRLKQPVRRTVQPEYAGCRSWVSLKEPVSLEGAEPVLDNRKFRAALEVITSRLER